MELVKKNINIIGNNIEVEMQKGEWEFLFTLKNDPDFPEFSNVENLILEAYNASKSNNFNVTLRAWLYDIYLREDASLWGILRPFPRSEQLVVLPTE